MIYGDLNIYIWGGKKTFKKRFSHWRCGSCCRWCEFTLLVVISCQGSSSLRLPLLVGGDQLGISTCSVSKSPWISLSIQRKQTVKGGSAGAKRGPALLLLFPVFNGLFICWKAVATEQGKRAFIRILLFNGVFFCLWTTGSWEVCPELTVFFHAVIPHNGVDCCVYI